MIVVNLLSLATTAWWPFTSPRKTGNLIFWELDPIFRDSFVDSWRRRNVVDLCWNFEIEVLRWNFSFTSVKAIKMSFSRPSVRGSRACNGKHLSSFPQYQSLAETFGCSVVHKTFMSDSFARCSGLYHHDLLGHFGCVNAIEFSSNGGEFIVSGAHLAYIRFCSLFCSFD